MLTVTHIAVSLLLIQLLSLDRNNAFIAMVFGVFIDLDHLIGLGSYAQANGLRPLADWSTLTNPGGQWKSLFHSPMALGAVVPMSFATVMAVPLVFWAVHVSMDYAEETFLGNFSSIEAMLLVLCSFALVVIRYSKYIESYSLGSLGDYIKYEFKGLRSMFGSSNKNAL
jgi:hypothetical protein